MELINYKSYIINTSFIILANFMVLFFGNIGSTNLRVALIGTHKPESQRHKSMKL